MPSQDKTGSLPGRITAPYMAGMRHLLDDSVLEESPCNSSDGSMTNATQGAAGNEGREAVAPQVVGQRTRNIKRNRV